MEEPAKLLNRNYALLLQGQFVSRLGTSLSSLVMLLWIKEVTDSATLMGLLSMLVSIPNVLFGVIGGTVADRFSRRKIISYCDIASGFALLALGALFYFAPGQTRLLTIGIVVLSVSVAVLDAFSTPAITASTPELVPRAHMARANTLAQLVLQLAFLLGQGVAGVFYRLLGAFWAAVSNGIACLYAGATETFMVIPQKLPEGRGDLRKQITEFRSDTVAGFRYVIGIRGLNRLVIASSIVTFFSAPLIFMIPFYVMDFLKLKEDWVGYFAAIYGIGAFVGAMTAGLMEIKSTVRSRVLVSTIILESIGYGLLGVIQTPYVASGLVLVGGVLSGFTGVYIVTIIQLTTPSEMRGRMFGFLGTIAASLAPIGVGLGGVVFDWIGKDITLLYVTCGAIMTGVNILLSSSREFRDFLAKDTDETSPLIPQSPAHAELP
ncbi:MAG: MFS transporter [Bacteroidota bacterium]